MTDFDSAPTHVEASGLPVMDHLGYLCRVPVEGSATGGAFSLVEERGQLGCMSPRHLHDRESETFIVLDGALEGWCEGETKLVEAGGVLHLPASREHAFRVASDIAHFYVLIQPAGFESFFETAGRPLEQSFDSAPPIPGPVPPEAVAALQEILTPLGCTITGPPPFTFPGA